MITWQRLADQSNNLYTSEDFEKAAYQLLADQVLYEGDRRTRIAYTLIDQHLSHYQDLFSRLGVAVKKNPFHSFIVALPNHHVAEKMRLSETRMALVLRRLYDDKMRRADVIDGEALITLEELDQSYRDLLKRSLPDRGEVKDLALAMKRFGIARIEDTDDVQRFQIVIRPAIADVFGESTLHQLAAYAMAAGEESPDEEA
jgi:hypothetical protein